MTNEEAKQLVLRIAREIRDDLAEPGYLRESTVERLAAELARASQHKGAEQKEKKA